jgi:hypothetical protein
LLVWFASQVAKDGDREPEWNQTLLFNLDGNQTDLHIRVFDQGTLSDDYLGRFDMSLYSLLEGGGGARSFELHDPENFRKIAGTIELSVSFEGTGGPAANAEVAPIVGPFHLLHNSSGFLVHPTGKTSGSGLALRAGGIDQQIVAFEFQGAYIRVCAVPGFYLHAHEGAAGGESTVTIEAGIGDLARWKWTGLGLQHVSSGKIVHPRGDVAASNTPLVLASGTSAASGFSLVPCKGPPVTPASDEGTPHPATNPHAAAAAAAAAPVSPASPHTPNSFDLTFPETWPLRAHITSHPHELVRTPQVYQGTTTCPATVFHALFLFAIL